MNHTEIPAAQSGNTVKYFPIPESEKPGRKFVSFADSWMEERNYGGKRGHEGTDLMAGEM